MNLKLLSNKVYENWTRQRLDLIALMEITIPQSIANEKKKVE